MKQTMTIREFLKEQGFNIAFNVTLIIQILLKYTGVMEQGLKFLAIGLFILLACLLLVKLINKLFLKLNLFKHVLEEKSKRKYMQLIKWSYRILVLIIIWQS
ncbi:hypothetical protein CN692_10920 [Bacillus sp. AFS002410]|uniref:hypothetical protein n=1 Tax=Bacillus sp. AFS002410 TaxID=2033481 RepID=UPI000BF02E0F|nr:hypothetical protein [Bacillus sp. AFS002410]PEJ57993.1 hypothetical protein CN692_10920 [Bacillus sp. AFS002410]